MTCDHSEQVTGCGIVRNVDRPSPVGHDRESARATGERAGTREIGVLNHRPQPVAQLVDGHEVPRRRPSRDQAVGRQEITQCRHIAEVVDAGTPDYLITSADTLAASPATLAAW
ncbi:MAG: hypothetical protein M3467_00060, partial [Actinomycetota bacterium]|nr:hypothetical protein [Actinomycetota bacterium]